MRIICEEGFYKFYPQSIIEVRRFADKYGVSLVGSNDYFTFQVLADLPNFSIKAQIYSGSIAGLLNYAAKKEKVMAANNLCYNQEIKDLSPKSSIKGTMNYSFSNYIIMDKLPQAYFRDANGIINGFSAFIDVDFMKYKIERFFYEDI